MKRTLKLVLQGLGTALPLGLTLWALVWLAATLERVTGTRLMYLLPDVLYFPGLGLLAGIGLLFVIGLLMNLYGMRYLIGLGERLVQKIPLAKSIYASISDISTVFSLAKNPQLQKVVRVDLGNGVYQIGFVTGEATGRRLFPQDDKVGVYLPMSYQIGGFTYYVDRDMLQPIDIGMEEAMRLTLTGGAQQAKTGGREPSR
jgi:uncharacterized membrane protein